jgi:hypothetical protein
MRNQACITISAFGLTEIQLKCLYIIMAENLARVSRNTAKKIETYIQNNGGNFSDIL